MGPPHFFSRVPPKRARPECFLLILTRPDMGRRHPAILDPSYDDGLPMTLTGTSQIFLAMLLPTYLF